MLLALLASVAVAGVAASPANAVKFGTPDTANAYPQVGLMVAVDEDGNPLWRCSGSLIERNLFLTPSPLCQRSVGGGWRPGRFSSDLVHRRRRHHRHRPAVPRKPRRRYGRSLRRR